MILLPSPVVFFAVLLALHLTSAVRISFEQVKQASNLQRRSGNSKFSVLAATDDDDGLDLSTVHDLIYMANFTVGNTVYPVQLDTGSSDVWVKGSSSPLPDCNDTTTTYNLTYGIGWVYGHIAYGPVRFAGINVSSQALLDVSTADNPALAYGADGLVGLGFTSLSSIDHAINATGASTGRSLLYNLFQDNPSEPNYIAFALQRSTDTNDTVQGTFCIGEVEPEYAAVLNGTALPTWPVSYPSRWNVLLEALLVQTSAGTTVVTPTTTVVNAPSNRAVVLLDSGTSYTYAPTAICDAIYSGISGAEYSSELGQWTIPCEAEVDIALQFGGEVFPIHPLDVTPTSLDNTSLCVGSFVPQTVSVGSGEFDWLMGDNVLRSVYSVYDFGDFDSSNNMGDPYVKLLSLVDPNAASADFHNARGGVAYTNITYNVANSTAASASSVSVSSDVSDTLNQIVTFLPAMLGIMALNAAVLIALIVFGIVFMCRKRKPRATARKSRGRMSPMPMGPRNSYIAGPDPQPHVYEPISMAVTEDLDRMRPMSMNPRDSFAAGVPLADRAVVSMAISEDDMFIPPSPAARTFKGSGLRPVDRPSSTVYQRQPSIAVSEDQLFVPPSPGFRNFSGNPGDRPKSAMYQRQPSEDSLIAPAHSFEDNRPRSVGYQRSPSEEDLIFVTSPTTMANEPVFSLPPPQEQAEPPQQQNLPPQRQAPPPPLRLAPQAPPQRAPPPPPGSPQRQSPSPHPPSPSPHPPSPHRQPSRDSMASVRLSDDQFAPGTSSPGPIPRPMRQPSNNNGLFVPREYTGRPGDRPQSFAPGPDGFPLAPPTPAFHADGGRPKSIA
ncbi:aspartic peptidase domain-containing protein [Mycena maculata]|uniref:Aspartic peptidase domain-containing protein n=1 Tax=Mycena maculata TaxID=230809 RepID=A0AAD7JTC6_9AGAR|nr:aspartic peptidase domain-containing protein [Mycena maculata]